MEEHADVDTELQARLQERLDTALHGLGASGQRARLLESLRDVIDSSTSKAYAQTPSRAIVKNAIWQFNAAIEWVDELQAALNPMVRDDDAGKALRKAFGDQTYYTSNPKDWLFPRRDLADAIARGAKSPHYWAVNHEMLSPCVATYLQASWGAVPWVERLMAEALVYAEVTTFAQMVQGRSFLGAMWGQRGVTIRAAVMGLAVLAISGVVFLGASDAYGLWAGIVATVLTYRLLLTSPANKELHRIGQLLGCMASVYQVLGHDPVSPSLVRHRLLETSDKGAVWPAGLANLVERVCARNAVTWDATPTR